MEKTIDTTSRYKRVPKCVTPYSTTQLIVTTDGTLMIETVIDMKTILANFPDKMPDHLKFKTPLEVLTNVALMAPNEHYIAPVPVEKPVDLELEKEGKEEESDEGKQLNFPDLKTPNASPETSI